MDEFKGLPTLEPHIQAFISTAEGFEKRYNENMPYYATYELAYEATERQYEFIIGQRKYADYNSFRACKNRRVAAVRRSAHPVRVTHSMTARNKK